MKQIFLLALVFGLNSVSQAATNSSDEAILGARVILAQVQSKKLLKDAQLSSTVDRVLLDKSVDGTRGAVLGMEFLDFSGDLRALEISMIEINDTTGNKESRLEVEIKSNGEVVSASKP